MAPEATATTTTDAVDPLLLTVPSGGASITSGPSSPVRCSSSVALVQYTTFSKVTQIEPDAAASATEVAEAADAKPTVATMEPGERRMPVTSAAGTMVDSSSRKAAAKMRASGPFAPPTSSVSKLALGKERTATLALLPEAAAPVALEGADVSGSGVDEAGIDEAGGVTDVISASGVDEAGSGVDEVGGVGVVASASGLDEAANVVALVSGVEEAANVVALVSGVDEDAKVVASASGVEDAANVVAFVSGVEEAANVVGVSVVTSACAVTVVASACVATVVASASGVDEAANVVASPSGVLSRTSVPKHVSK